MPKELYQVPGDGNCLFNSVLLAASNIIAESQDGDISTIRNQLTLRVLVRNYYNAEPESRVILKEMLKDAVKIGNFAGYGNLSESLTALHEAYQKAADDDKANVLDTGINDPLVQRYINGLTESVPPLWGSGSELQVLSKKLKVKIKLSGQTNPIDHTDLGDAAPEIEIQYQGRNHYNAYVEGNPFADILANTGANKRDDVNDYLKGLPSSSVDDISQLDERHFLQLFEIIHNKREAESSPDIGYITKEEIDYALGFMRQSKILFIPERKDMSLAEQANLEFKKKYLPFKAHITTLKKTDPAEYQRILSISLDADLKREDFGSLKDYIGDKPADLVEFVEYLGEYKREIRQRRVVVHGEAGALVESLLDKADSSIKVQIHVKVDGTLGADPALEETKKAISLDGRSDVLGESKSQMRHVTPVALINRVFINTVDGVAGGSGTSRELLGQLLHISDSVITSNAILLTSEELQKMVMPVDGTPIQPIAHGHIGEEEYYFVDVKTRASLITNDDNRRIFEDAAKDGKREKIKEEFIIADLFEYYKSNYLSKSFGEFTPAAQVLIQRFITICNQHEGAAFPTEGNTRNYEVRNKSGKVITDFSRGQVIERIVNDEGSTVSTSIKSLEFSKEQLDALNECINAHESKIDALKELIGLEVKAAALQSQIDAQTTGRKKARKADDTDERKQEDDIKEIYEEKKAIEVKIVEIKSEFKLSDRYDVKKNLQGTIQELEKVKKDKAEHVDVLAQALYNIFDYKKLELQVLAPGPATDPKDTIMVYDGAKTAIKTSYHIEDGSLFRTQEIGNIQNPTSGKAKYSNSVVFRSEKEDDDEMFRLVERHFIFVLEAFPHLQEETLRTVVINKFIELLEENFGRTFDLDKKRVLHTNIAQRLHIDDKSSITNSAFSDTSHHSFPTGSTVTTASDDSDFSLSRSMHHSPTSSASGTLHLEETGSDVAIRKSALKRKATVIDSAQSDTGGSGYEGSEDHNTDENSDHSDTEDNNLKRYEKKLLSNMSSSFSLIDELSRTEAPEMLSRLSTQIDEELHRPGDITTHSVSDSRIGHVTLIAETNHGTEHGDNIQKLINQIHTGEITTNTVICIERKQEGHNLGIKDVVLLANILDYNKGKSDNEQFRVSESIANSQIYQDALLYQTAREKGISVIGVEGKSLEHSKESPEYNSAREEHMAQKLQNIINSGKNAVFVVGAAHTKRLESKLGEEGVKVETLVGTNGSNSSFHYSALVGVSGSESSEVGASRDINADKAIIGHSRKAIRALGTYDPASFATEISSNSENTGVRSILNHAINDRRRQSISK